MTGLTRGSDVSVSPGGVKEDSRLLRLKDRVAFPWREQVYGEATAGRQFWTHYITVGPAKWWAVRVLGEVLSADRNWRQSAERQHLNHKT